MSSEMSLSSAHSLTNAGRKPTSMPIFAGAKKLGKFIVYTVPAVLAMITAKAGADVISV